MLRPFVAGGPGGPPLRGAYIDITNPAKRVEAQKTDQITFVSTETDDPMVGVTIGGRFRVLGKIDSCGLADVYKACDVGGARTVALKIIRVPQQPGTPGYETFTSNARNSVQHPSFVSVYATGVTEEGEPWLALEWIEGGRTLEEILREEGAIGLEAAMRILAPVADALGYAHGKGEVHMNVKPGNVIVAERDGKQFVKICDFGYAKMLIEREMEMADERAPAHGTPLYMSPEQFKGTRIDSRTDVYSFGCVLYECIFGRPPHQGVDLLETMDRHMHVDLSFPSEPETSEQLQAFLTKLLAKDIVRRYRTMQDVLSDLERVKNGEHPKEEQLPMPTVDAARGVDFITAKRGTAPPKGKEPWMLLMACLTLLLFVIIFQQCMTMVNSFDDRKHDRRHSR